MHVKVFQKKQIKQSTPQSGLKPPRPFAQPNPPAQQSGAPTLDAVERAVRYGHNFARVAVRDAESDPERKRRNVTGLPERLKAGVERLSGLSLDDVRVRYNSPAPARYRALAHTQGTEIHVGAGQEKHLAHEAWHIVQQKQGRVRPTMRMKGGVAVNNDEGLEREADMMGAKALAGAGTGLAQHAWKGGRAEKTHLNFFTQQAAPIQGFWPFTDTHAPPANLGNRVRHLRDTLAGASPQQQADADWYSTQQNNLAGVETDAHAWLRNHGHHATEDQRQEVATHLNALEDHHAALVGVQRANNHPLWLPGGTAGPDRLRANQVWADVQNNAGNVTIDNSNPAFRDNALADVAKLLQQPHGRDMLHELNANPQGVANGQVRIGANWSGTFGAVGRAHQQGSWATPLVDNTQLHRRRHDGTPNAGMGSYVQIDRAHRETETGAQGTGVPMPHYLTLGHELGHALHSLRGTSTNLPEHSLAFSNLNQTDQSLWSNPEEHTNITQNENVMRAQHGLPARAYHRPPNVVRATHMKNDLRGRIEQVRDDFPEHDLRHIDPAEPDFYEQEGINEPAFYERANAHISSLYRRRNLKRGALALGGGALALLGGYGIYRGTR
jgi:hypothetical protein